ncbi:MAG: hypothetical protein MR210_02990 [Erysipelotrichaceae bacterium]|nr:hypothetical protein [Erysipelotrichaceae bacterium]
MADKIINETNINAEHQYILELIECNVTSTGNISLVSDDDYPIYLSDKLVVTFLINTPSYDDTELILNTIKGTIDELNDEITKTYGQFNSYIVEENINQVVNTEYQTLQKSKTDLLNSYNNTFKALEKNFTGNNLEYYQTVYLNQKIEDVHSVEIPKENCFKWLLIGEMIAILCWGCYGVLRYILDKKIKTIDELKGRYGLPVIGYINISATQKGLNGLIDIYRMRSNGTFDSISSIQSIINDNTLICLETSDLQCNEIASNLIQNNKTNAIINDLHNNISSIKDLENYKEIILISKLYETSYDQITKDLNICRLKNIKIKGMIIVA